MLASHLDHILKHKRSQALLKQQQQEGQDGHHRVDMEQGEEEGKGLGEDSAASGCSGQEGVEVENFFYSPDLHGWVHGSLEWRRVASDWIMDLVSVGFNKMQDGHFILCKFWNAHGRQGGCAQILVLVSPDAHQKDPVVNDPKVSPSNAIPLLSSMLLQEGRTLSSLEELEVSDQIGVSHFINFMNNLLLIMCFRTCISSMLLLLAWLVHDNRMCTCARAHPHTYTQHPHTTRTHPQAASEAFKAHGLHKLDDLCATLEGQISLGIPPAKDKALYAQASCASGEASTEERGNDLDDLSGGLDSSDPPSQAEGAWSVGGYSVGYSVTLPTPRSPTKCVMAAGLEMGNVLERHPTSTLVEMKVRVQVRAPLILPSIDIGPLRVEPRQLMWIYPGPSMHARHAGESVGVSRRDTWMRENEAWLRDNRYEDEEEHQHSLAARMEATYGDEEYLSEYFIP
eukprot:scaffold260091_cov18-Tisochrysis_lutea.AAC.1